MIRELKIEDYEEIIKLFLKSPGIVIRDADSKENIEKYLNRNPGLSFVFEEDTTIVGVLMAGHDGRRGYLNHLFVQKEYRGRKIGTKLVNKVIEELRKIGIFKSHILIFRENEKGINFWKSLGWELREDLFLYSFTSNNSKNA